MAMKKVLTLFNLAAAVVLGLGCLVPFISFSMYPIIAGFGIIIPILVVINIFFLAFWMIFKSRRLFISLFSLLLFVLLTDSFFQWRFSEKMNHKKNLSIMSFNAMSFNANEIIEEPHIENKIVDFIAREDPDVVCFQEFDYRRIRTNDFDQYPYKYVDFEFGVFTGRVVQAIYSKYPIVDKGIIDFPNSSNSAMYADIVLQQDTIRIYNLHLQSLKIRPSSFTKESYGAMYRRLGRVFAQQEEQARLVNLHRATMPSKQIVCGDFNNTQFSRIYRQLRGDYKDTFIEKGRGYGRTYEFSIFPVRIDFIFVHPEIEVLSHKNYNLILSDHYPVMATMHL